MEMRELIKRVIREEYGRKNILYRAVGLDEAIKSCETGHLVYYSRNPMSRDWEVIEYGLGSQASEMSEEEVQEYVNDLVSWKLKSKGVNLTSDLDNAKGYSDIVLEINLVGYDYAEFSDVHIFAKNPDDSKILSVYYNGKEYSKEQFLDITKSLQESVKRILREEIVSSVKDYLFQNWDENGPSLDIGKYFSLSEFETAKYLFEYRGYDFDEVKKQVKSLIENYDECEGDEFSLRLEGINFVPHKEVPIDGSGINEWFSYDVNFSIKNDSPVFSTINLSDLEDVLYGQIEGCVENMLNNTIYLNYGIPVYHCLFVGIYE